MTEPCLITATFFWTKTPIPKISLPKSLRIDTAKREDFLAWIEAVNRIVVSWPPLTLQKMYFGDGSKVLFCRDQKNRLVGVGGWCNVGERSMINYTGVLSSERRKGIGSALVLDSLRRAVAVGRRKVYVATTLDPIRLNAIRMYLKLGFRFVSSSNRWSATQLQRLLNKAESCSGIEEYKECLRSL